MSLRDLTWAEIRAAFDGDDYPPSSYEICTCPNCLHPTARHGTGYVEIEGRQVIVFACLDCPRNACVIKPVGSQRAE